MNQEVTKLAIGVAPKSEKAANPTQQTTESLGQDSYDISNQLPSFVDFLPEQILPYWSFIDQYPLAEAATIFTFFFVIAYVIRRYVLSLIERLADNTETELDDYVFDQIRTPIFNAVMLIGLIIATKSAGFTEGIWAFLTPVCLSLIVLIVVKSMMNVLSTTISVLSNDENKFKKLDSRTEPLLIISTKLISALIGAYIVLIIWGIDPVGLLASAGIVGIAFGFAAKDTLANLFSGIFILADRPYKLGDYVNLASGERGKITYIGIRSTRLMTRDDIEITVPNGVIGNEKVINESGGPNQKMRVRITLQVAYESDLGQVETVLMDVVDTLDEICKFPTPRVRYRSFDDSGITLQLMGWIDQPEDRGRVSHLLLKAIHQAFNEHNIEIPYPRYVNIPISDLRKESN